MFGYLKKKNNIKKGEGDIKYLENDWYYKRKYGKVNFIVLVCLNKLFWVFLSMMIFYL